MNEFKKAFGFLDQYIGEQMEATNVPGMAVAVTDREKLLRVSVYGFANVDARTAVTPETLFEIGSIGKSFTSMVLLQLHEEGLLDLHQPITHYLPWFEVQSGYEPLTPHHLMSHTGAITHGPEFPGEARCEVWTLRETETTAPPGTYYHYSDAGYKTLGVVLEELLGLPYGDIIQGRILDPLEMTGTVPVVTNETRHRLAVGYESAVDDRPSPPGRPIAPATWLEHSEGAGSIASTPADMATYLRMLLNRGQGPRGRILSEESFELMTRRAIEAQEEGDGIFYGYGLEIRDNNGHATISHSGGMVGYYAYMMADMDDGLGVVVLMNGPGGKIDEEVATFALDLLRSTLHDRELPPLPSTDAARIEDITGYAGTYRGSDPANASGRKAGVEGFTVAAEGERLMLHHGDERVVLVRRSPDCFYADHPDFPLFLLRFGREEGRVVEAFHGPHWYLNDRYTGPTTFDYPEEWHAFPGHYRSHNPWFSNFRVVLRKGKLTLTDPSGEEEPMEPVGGVVFRVGDDDGSPERIRFDAIVNEQALRANLSCCDYYRAFTP